MKEGKGREEERRGEEIGNGSEGKGEGRGEERREW